jgi:hypothetical protein
VLRPSHQDLARELHAHGSRLLLFGFIAGAASAGVALAIALGWQP